MSGLTNTTGFSFLGLTNLTQGNYDNLFVNNLTANTGTIIVLNSITGTITTLNSTTANITNLIGDIWQGTSTTSNMRVGSSSDTSGVISVYKTMAMFKNLNFNTSTGMLYCSNINSWNGGATDIAFSQGISLASAKNITINGGYLVVETIRGYAYANAVNMYLNQVGAISFGNNLGTGGGITFNDNITIAASRKITTPGILVSGLTASKMVLTDASKNLVSSSYTDSDFARLAASNTFTGTTNTFLGDVQIGQFSPSVDKSLYFKFHLPLDPTDGVYLSLYQTTGSTYICDTISLGDIHIGNSASPITQTGSIFLYGNTSISSGKNLLCNTITGTTISSAISLFGTSTSLIDLGNPSSTSVIRLNQNTSLTAGKILRTPYLYPTSTVADLYVGNQATDSGILYIELNTDLHSSRKLKLNNTTASKLLLTNASKEIISSAYDETTLPVSTPTQTALNLKANINAPVFTTSIGLTSGDITISSGKLVNNTFQGTTAASNINLFSLTTGLISIGGVSSTISLQDNVVTAIGKTLTMTTSGSIINNIYRGISVGNAISLFSTTTGSITLGGASSGISLADNTTLPANKTLTLSTTGSVLSPTYNSTSATQALTIGGTNTTASITIGGGQTSGAMFIGGGADTGSTLTCYKNINIDSNRSITLSTNGVVYSDYFHATTASAALQLGQSSTTGSITIGGLQTTGNVNLSTTSATGRVVARNKIEFRTASDSCYINTNSGANIFTASSLAGMYITNTTYAGAPTDNWSCWDSNATPAGPAPGDGSAIVQNGNTTMIINPGDNSTLWWLDEDNFAATTSWAWSGWKVSTLGVITNSSDRRIKRDITPITEGGNTLLDKLSLIQYVNFKLKAPTDDKYYKNGKLRQKYQDIHKGLIAQDVKEIFPDVVKRENANAYWTITHQDVDIYFNMGVQELIKRDKEKQAQIDTQKVLIDDLTTRLIRLEQILLNP